MADRIVLQHVKRIVRAQHDAVGAIGLHQRFKLMRRKDDRVEIDVPPQIGRRRLRQVAVRIRSRAPGMIDAAGIGAEKTAAVHGQNAKLGMPFEDAVEDQVVKRHRGVERIADDVVEVEAPETLRLGEAGRVDQHQRVELLGLLPERRESRIGQLLAVDVGENLDALEAELLHAALELLGRFVAVLHRHAAERDQPVLVLADIFGDAVVERAGGLHADIDGQVVIDLRRRRADELHVDAHLVHHAETLIRGAYARADVGRLLCHQCLRLGRRVLNQRIGGIA